MSDVVPIEQEAREVTHPDDAMTVNDVREVIGRRLKILDGKRTGNAQKDEFLREKTEQINLVVMWIGRYNQRNVDATLREAWADCMNEEPLDGEPKSLELQRKAAQQLLGKMWVDTKGNWKALSSLPDRMAVQALRTKGKENLTMGDILLRAKDMGTGITEHDLRNIRNRLSGKLGFERKVVLMHGERLLSCGREELFDLVRKYTVEAIRQKEQGSLYHYHVTGWSGFEGIIEEGALLSRSKLEKKHPGMVPSSFSSSEEVMMTRDHYNERGKLTRKGLKEDLAIGALNRDIALVLKPEIMRLETYDPTPGEYPLASEIPVNYIRAVLVRERDEIDKVKKILEKHNCDGLQVATTKEWEQRTYEGQ